MHSTYLPRSSLSSNKSVNFCSFASILVVSRDKPRTVKRVRLAKGLEFCYVLSKLSTRRWLWGEFVCIVDIVSVFMCYVGLSPTSWWCVSTRNGWWLSSSSGWRLSTSSRIPRRTPTSGWVRCTPWIWATTYVLFDSLMYFVIDAICKHLSMVLCLPAIIRNVMPYKMGTRIVYVPLNP